MGRDAWPGNWAWSGNYWSRAGRLLPGISRTINGDDKTLLKEMEMREQRRLSRVLVWFHRCLWWQDFPASCSADSVCEEQGGAAHHLHLEVSPGRAGSLQPICNPGYHFGDEGTDGRGCLKVKCGVSETQKPSSRFAGLPTWLSYCTDFFPLLFLL